jgi:hypothetical protein
MRELACPSSRAFARAYFSGSTGGRYSRSGRGIQHARRRRSWTGHPVLRPRRSTDDLRMLCQCSVLPIMMLVANACPPRRGDAMRCTNARRRSAVAVVLLSPFRSFDLVRDWFPPFLRSPSYRLLRASLKCSLPFFCPLSQSRRRCCSRRTRSQRPSARGASTNSQRISSRRSRRSPSLRARPTARRQRS